MELRTERMVLKRLSEVHRADMIAFYGDAEVMAIRKYGARDPVAASLAVDVALEHWREHGFGLFAVHDGASDEFMGECGLRHVDGGDLVEVSYGLFPRYQGGGRATEAARACLAHGFSTLRLPLIVAFSRSTNVASHRVLEKIGMTFVGREDRGAHGVVRYEARRAG
jgi:ribosomal-protein-alanine N-acetyltransferase